MCFWGQSESCQKQVMNKKGNLNVEISTIKDCIPFLYLHCASRLNQVTDLQVPLLLAYFPSSLNSSLWSLVNCNVQDYNMENVFVKIELDPKRKKYTPCPNFYANGRRNLGCCKDCDCQVKVSLAPLFNLDILTFCCVKTYFYDQNLVLLAPLGALSRRIDRDNRPSHPIHPIPSHPIHL